MVGLLSVVGLDVLTLGLWPSCWKEDAICGFELRRESTGKSRGACKGLLASIPTRGYANVEKESDAFFRKYAYR